jgi:hypothetical protein
MVHFSAIHRSAEHASLDEVFDRNIPVAATSADGYGAGCVLNATRADHHHNA